MFAKILCLVTVAVCLVGSGTFAQPAFDTAKLDTFVEKMMDAYNVPGVGLAVVEDGEISYVRGYGVRDVTTGAPVLPNTQFGVGSVTKSFTALGVMLLVEEGRVELDAPVVRYLPEFELADPEATRTATVRHLLSHTTGLARTDASTFDPSVTAADIIKAAATTLLVGKPGETFVYSNVNTIVAGAVIERVTGQSWAAFTRERILEPLEMMTTTLSVAELERQPDVAAPHELDVLSGPQPTEFLTLGADAPAGALNSSAAEMARYLRFELGDGAPLVSQEGLRLMHTRQVDTAEFSLAEMISAQAQAVAEQPRDVPRPLTTTGGYGFYWGVERFRGATMVEHGGNVTGFTANVTLLPERRSGVVILSNVGGANYFNETLRLHVAGLLLGDVQPDVNRVLQTQLGVLGQDNASREADLEAARTYRPEPGELAALAGRYEGAADPEPTRVRVARDRTLWLESGFQEVRFRVKLFPLGEGRFLSNTQPLIGAVIRFGEGDGERTVNLETAGGTLPLAARRGRD